MTNNHLPRDGLEPLDEFCQDRLNSPPNDEELKELGSNEAIQAAVKAFCACTTTDYEKLGALLNIISAAVKEKWLPEDVPLIEFLVVATKNMHHHPNNYFDSRPDLVAVLSSIADALREVNKDAKVKVSPCWYHILSLAEQKRTIDMSAGPAQAGTYLGLAEQARPDKVGMLRVPK